MRIQAIRCRIRLFAAVVLTLSLGVVITEAPVQAQVAAGTIQGTVADNTGAVLPNVAVLIENIATGVRTNATTTSDGFFSVPNLLPGTYRVSVTAIGFATAANPNCRWPLELCRS